MEDETIQNGIIFKLDSDTLTATAFRMENFFYEGKISIPDLIHFEGQVYAVNEIADFAFDGCAYLKDIKIPESIKRIGDSAFCGCEEIEKIRIPASVNEIGKRAFENCASLENIRVDRQNPVFCDIEGVLFNKNKDTLIAFPFAKGGDYEIPEGVTRIADNAFNGCEEIEEIIMPDTIVEIGDHAFSHCESLKRVTMPDSVVCIRNNAFDDCHNLKSVETFDTGIIYDPDELNLPAEIGDSAFRFCSELQDLELPKNIQEIGSFAFFGCSELDSMVLPKSITEIGECAFNDCSNLEEITLPRQVEIGSLLFSGCINLKNINKV